MISDSVNHPQHYTQGKYETIELIESIAGEHYTGYLIGNIEKFNPFGSKYDSFDEQLYITKLKKYLKLYEDGEF